MYGSLDYVQRHRAAIYDDTLIDRLFFTIMATQPSLEMYQKMHTSETLIGMIDVIRFIDLQ